jgi:hypothetical protein
MAPEPNQPVRIREEDRILPRYDVGKFTLRTSFQIKFFSYMKISMQFQTQNLRADVQEELLIEDKEWLME